MNSTPLHTGTTTSTDQPGSLAPHSNDRRPHPPSHFPPAKPQDAPPQKTRHPAPNPRTRPETAIPGDDRTKLARMGEGRDNGGDFSSRAGFAALGPYLNPPRGRRCRRCPEERSRMTKGKTLYYGYMALVGLYCA